MRRLVELGAVAATEAVFAADLDAVYLSRELARLGHEVEVAGQVTPCVDQGVRYVDYLGYLRGDPPVTPARKLECDVFVSSRDFRAAARESLKRVSTG